MNIFLKFSEIDTKTMSTIEIPKGKFMDFVFGRIQIVCGKKKKRHRGHSKRKTRKNSGSEGKIE